MKTAGGSADAQLCSPGGSRALVGEGALLRAAELSQWQLPPSLHQYSPRQSQLSAWRLRQACCAAPCEGRCKASRALHSSRKRLPADVGEMLYKCVLGDRCCPQLRREEVDASSYGAGEGHVYSNPYFEELNNQSLMHDILGFDGIGRQEVFAPPQQPVQRLVASDAFSTPANPRCSPPAEGRDVLDVFGRPIREPCDANLDALEGSLAIEDVMWGVQQEVEEIVSVPEILGGEPRNRSSASSSARGASRGRMIAHSALSANPCATSRTQLGLTLRQTSRAAQGGHEQADLGTPTFRGAERGRRAEVCRADPSAFGIGILHAPEIAPSTPIIRGSSSTPRLASATSLLPGESFSKPPRPRSAGPQDARFTGLLRAGGDDDDVQPEELPPPPKKFSAAGAASISAIMQVVAKAEALPKQQKPNSEKWVERWGHYNAGHWAR